MVSNKIKENKVVIWLLLAMVATLWGLSFFASTSALHYVGPFELLSVRWTIAALIFLTLIGLRVVKVDFKSKFNIKNRATRYLLLLVTFQPCLYATFEILGIKHTTTSESSIIIALIPIVVIVLSRLLYKEKYSLKVKLATATAFLGLVITTLFAPSFSFGGGGIGYLYLFLAITMGGCYNLAVRETSKSYSVVEMSTAMTVVGMVFFNAISLGQGNGLHPWETLLKEGNFTLAALYLGVGCSFLAYMTSTYILTKLPPGIASCLQANGVTVVGALSGILIAGDTYGWYTFVGMALICIGIAVVSLEGNKDLKKEYRLIIFDLDGTLLNTLDDITDSLNHVLNCYNFETRSAKQVEAALGNGYKMLIKRSIPAETGEETIEAMLADFRKYYRAHSTIKTRPYDDILETVDMLSAKGYMLAIASNKGQDGVDVLRTRFFNETIPVAYGSRNGLKRKPDPEMINQIIKDYGVSKENVLYVGDSEVDIRTAENARVDYVITTWGYRSKERMIKAGAKNFISAPGEICRYLS